jgi:putative ABC transport system permease protein
LGAAIGLMNIMLVSVTERTREIGICKSLGATRRTILVQFLVEAIVICQIGGLVGIVFGILAGNAVTFVVGGAFVIPWAWIALGFSLCFVVGIISGLYPAVKASKLDPIEALRYE